MYEHIGQTERLRRIGEILLKGVYLWAEATETSEPGQDGDDIHTAGGACSDSRDPSPAHVRAEPVPLSPAHPQPEPSRAAARTPRQKSRQTSTARRTATRS